MVCQPVKSSCPLLKTLMKPLHPGIVFDSYVLLYVCFFCTLNTDQNSLNPVPGSIEGLLNKVPFPSAIDAVVTSSASRLCQLYQIM